MKKALIFWGGWSGHEPEKVSLRLQRLLQIAFQQVLRFVRTC